MSTDTPQNSYNSRNSILSRITPWWTAAIDRWWLMKPVRRILQTPFLKNAALLAGSTAASQAIGMLSIPILSRLYSEHEFGILTVFASLCGPLMLVITGQFDQAIPLPEQDQKRASLLEFTLGLIVISSLLIGGIAHWNREWIAQSLKAPDLASYLWLLPFSLMGAGCFSALSMWSLQKKAFSIVAASNLKQTLFRAGSQILLGLIGLKPAGLMVGEALGNYGGVGSLARQNWRRDRDLFGRSSLKEMVQAAWEYRRFPLMVMPSASINILANSAAQLLLTSLFGVPATGLFGMASRLTAFPVTLIGNSLGQAFYADLATRKNDIAHHRRRFRDVSLTLFGAGVLGSLVLVFAPVWAGPLLGPKWHTAGWVVAAFAPMLIGRIVVAPVSRTYLVYGKQHLLLILDIVRLALILSMFGIAKIYAWSFLTAVLSFSLCMFSIYLIHWLVIAWILYSYVPPIEYTTEGGQA